MATLHVIVVGAGIAGLACAISLARYTSISVTVLERHETFRQIGNGIQIPCNASHVLRTLGLLDKVIARAGGPSTKSISVDYMDGRELVTRDLARCEELYGAPWVVIHRADYIDVLHQEAVRLGVEVKLNCPVQSIDFDEPSLRLETGKLYTADVIVGCDGIYSTIRTAIHPHIKPVYAGSFAYRALFARLELSSPSLDRIVPSSGSRFWLGPDAHGLIYPIRSGSIVNLVMVVDDIHFNERAQKGNALQLLRDRFRDWDPDFRDILNRAEKLVMFPLWEVEELPTWQKDRVVLMGDAAHPTLPYLAQGAAMAVEDAIILGTLLGNLTLSHRTSASSACLRSHIASTLNAYVSIQQPRTTRIVSLSSVVGEYDHMGPGPGKDARDAEFAAFDAETTVSKSAWLDAAANRDILGRRAGEVAEREFRRLVEENGWKCVAAKGRRQDGPRSSL